MRKARRYLPTVAELECRQVLNAGFRPVVAAWHAAHRVHTPRPRPAPRSHPTPRPRPAPLIDFVNTQYAAFATDFRAAEQVYLNALAAQSTGQQTVSATLSQAYVPGSGVLAVSDGMTFGNPSASAPLQLTAMIGGQPVQLFQATGRTGNVLIGVAAFDPASQAFTSPGIPLPASTTQLVATVPASGSAASAAGLFTSYVFQRAEQLAQDLVTFLNRLPVKLPRVPGQPRKPGPRNAVQLYTTSTILGSDPNSLISTLQAIPLPVDLGPSRVLYEATTGTAIDQSRSSLLEGMRLLFANRGLNAPISTPTTIPLRGGNQLGMDFSGL